MPSEFHGTARMTHGHSNSHIFRGKRSNGNQVCGDNSRSMIVIGKLEVRIDDGVHQAEAVRST